jgi:molecular chaperone GrpE
MFRKQDMSNSKAEKPRDPETGVEGSAEAMEEAGETSQPQAPGTGSAPSGDPSEPVAGPTEKTREAAAESLETEGQDAEQPSAEEEIQALQDELAQLRDKHLRLAAEFENYRKRVSADLAGGWARAQADLVRSLAEGLDDLQRVSQFTSEDTTVDALIEGVDLVERNFMKALGDAGLEVLNPEGERFDPNTMEAMMRVPAEEEGQDETVHQVFQKGYLFKEQLVRPARVSVFKDDD